MKFQQAPGAVFMVRPVSFGYNEETAASNTFQQTTQSPTQVQTLALREFDAMIALLQENNIEVIVLNDSPDQIRPDAIFPNNWMSIHENGSLMLYPMLAPNRRLERRADFVELIQQQFEITSILDFSGEESNKKIVEGTGSLVFDHVNKIAYANRSERTNEELVAAICKQLGYQPIIFNAVDEQQKPIYHTNVLMCVGEKFAILCLDAIRNDDDQERILASLADTNHKVIAISYAQLKAFAGNMLEVKNTAGEPIIILSQAAFNSLLPGQIDALSRFADLLPISIPTIEAVGGGSVRCMVGGIHARKK